MPALSESQAREQIVRSVKVLRQDVCLAKDFVMKHIDSSAEAIINRFLEAGNATMPPEVVLHESVDAETQLTQAARSISSWLACCEAIWELIHANYLLPAAYDWAGKIPDLAWTTIVNRGSGTRSGWRFDDIPSIPVPSVLRVPPSRAGNAQPLYDGDLYITELAIPDVHEEVETALRDAVACYRNGLMGPCVVMLGKAAEGAWTELGLALAGAVPADHSKVLEKASEELTSPHNSIAKKILVVLALFDRQDLLRPVRDLSGVDPRRLREEATWADVVRQYRNTVHYGVETTLTVTQDKVAVLLIGTTSHLRLVYAVRRAALRVQNV